MFCFFFTHYKNELRNLDLETGFVPLNIVIFCCKMITCDLPALHFVVTVILNVLYLKTFWVSERKREHECKGVAALECCCRGLSATALECVELGRLWIFLTSVLTSKAPLACQSSRNWGYMAERLVSKVLSQCSRLAVIHTPVPL